MAVDIRPVPVTELRVELTSGISVGKSILSLQPESTGKFNVNPTVTAESSPTVEIESALVTAPVICDDQSLTPDRVRDED